MSELDRPNIDPRVAAALEDVAVPVGAVLQEDLFATAPHPRPSASHDDARVLGLDLFAGRTAPSVSLLLSVDREYRRKVRLGQLYRVAPSRFNPGLHAWLPVLHAQRGDWLFQVMFSNTARAHRLAKTNDWVVLYYDRGDQQEHATVVTERRGDLAGKRVVRGLEAECRVLYESRKRNAACRRAKTDVAACAGSTSATRSAA